MSRKSPIFSRDTSIASGESVPDWFSDFARNLEKTSVQSREQDNSIYDQVSEIMGRKSKYSTVEDAVRDYRERTGLDAYLRKIVQVAETVKKASAELEVELNGTIPIPKSLQKIEGVASFAEKYIESFFGDISPSAVAQAMYNHFGKNGFSSALQDDPIVLKFISDLLADYEKSHHKTEPVNSEAGTVDTEIDDNNSDNDALGILMPAKIASSPARQKVDNFKDSAQNEDWYSAGKYLGELEALEDERMYSAVEAIRCIKYFNDPEAAAVKVPMEQWLVFTEGYCDGRGKNAEAKMKDIEVTKKVLERLSVK